MATALHRPLHRARRMLVALRDRIIDQPLHRRLLGDPQVTRDHAEVAAALTGLATVAGVLLGTTGVVVSPVVWDVVLLASATALAALVFANAYWHGGVGLGYALALGPVLGGAAGGVVGTFAVGFVHAAALLGIVVGVPVVHVAGVGVRFVGRRLR